MDKDKNRNIFRDGGSTPEAEAFSELLEDMAAKARYLAGALDILADMEDSPPDDPTEGSFDELPEAEPETDLFLIPGSAFRLLVGDLYELYTHHFSLNRRLAEAATEKDFRKIQKRAAGYGRMAKNLCRRWGLPKDGEEGWAYDTLEESLREKILTPAYPAEGHE